MLIRWGAGNRIKARFGGASPSALMARTHLDAWSRLSSHGWIDATPLGHRARPPTWAGKPSWVIPCVWEPQPDTGLDWNSQSALCRDETHRAQRAASVTATVPIGRGRSRPTNVVEAKSWDRLRAQPPSKRWDGDCGWRYGTPNASQIRRRASRRVSTGQSPLPKPPPTSYSARTKETQ
jgi:hypothetical protein